LAAAARVFDALGRSVAETGSGPGGFASPAELSTAELQAQLPAVERWLRELDRIGVTDWPDTRWALRLCDARVAAMRRLGALTTSLYAAPTGLGAMEGNGPAGVAADAEDLADALRTLRDLIDQRYLKVCRA